LKPTFQEEGASFTEVVEGDEDEEGRGAGGGAEDGPPTEDDLYKFLS
jgi:hypothetical protein